MACRLFLKRNIGKSEKRGRKGIRSLELTKISSSRYDFVYHMPNNPPLRSAGAIFACRVKPEGSVLYFQPHDRE